MWIQAPKQYDISEISEIDLISYTQHPFSKNKKFTLDNMYFKKDKEKFELMEDVLWKWDYIIFDTETSWRNLLWEDIPFQISAIKYRNNIEVDRLNVIMNIWEIPQVVLDLTWFSQELINKTWISLVDGLQKFIKFIQYDKYLIAHNADFDVAILNNALVATDLFINKDISVLCSMQIYYTVYKHYFKQWVGWSSLDLLWYTLINVNINDEKRHQADFDCEVVKVLLEKISMDILKDYESENSKIIHTIDVSDTVERNIYAVSKNYKDEKIINWLHERWTQISDLFEDYIDNYYLLARDIWDSIIKYFQLKQKEEYPEIIYNNFYIKRNKEFDFVKEEYLESYSSTKIKAFTKKWYEIDFFNNDFIENDANIYKINSEKELMEYIIEFKRLKTEMVSIQMQISSLLKIIKAHHNSSWYSKYWDLTIIKEKSIWYNQRMPSIKKIESAINKWLIKSKDDLFSRRDSYMNLTVEEIKK